MRYSEELEILRSNNLYRVLKRVKVDNPFAYIDNNRVLHLCSNDYLGLSKDERVLNAMRDSLSIGSQCSSRLIAGNDPTLEELEARLAKHKGMDKALVYSTGYMANLAIATLASKDTLIVSDELNHASIIDACKLSKSTIRTFKHNDINDLVDKLQGNYKEKMVITEGVFSMDGDISNLKEIASITKENNALLILDDAHGDFIYGKNFKGTQEELNANVDIIISSLSKGLGLFGGYIASNDEIIDYLINRSRSFIYTSALPAHIAIGAIEALNIVKEGTRQRLLFESTKFLRNGLIDLGFNIIGSSHIIPIIIGNELRTIEVANKLLTSGLFIQPIRYPTVMKGKARLRLSITALHRGYIDDIIDIFRRISYEI
jgi:glycine C-acetyltransferase